MAAIKYVCLSDTHFGAETSVLTNLETTSREPDPSVAGPVMQSLVECLKAVLETRREGVKPTLVLNGDIFELALASDERAAMVFQRFLELVMPEGGMLFDRIVYLPGNHDHHLWESARETQYVDYLKSIPLSSTLPRPWHTTKVFMLEEPVAVPAFFPTKLAQRYPHLHDFVIRTAYPNFGVRNENGSKWVLFHHGHYTEPIYTLMSTLKRMIFPGQPEPATAWDIEAENYAWIDYFWSTLGRSGQAGLDVGIIYDKIQDHKQFRILLDNLANGLAHRWSTSRLGRKVGSALLGTVLHFIARRLVGTERHKTDGVLTRESENGLRWYLNIPFHNQVLDELEISAVTSDVTFVFGHTHKPFQQDVELESYPGGVGVYNTGGWTVDAPDPRSTHGGAVVLVDEEMNATSLRMYNEQQDPAAYRVSVQQAPGASNAPNDLTDRIGDIVDPTRDPWKSFSASVSRAVQVRRQGLRSRIDETFSMRG